MRFYELNVASRVRVIADFGEAFFTIGTCITWRSGVAKAIQSTSSLSLSLALDQHSLRVDAGGCRDRPPDDKRLATSSL